MMRLVAAAGNSRLTIRPLIVLLKICWLVESEIFIELGIKRGVRKLLQSFVFVEETIAPNWRGNMLEANSFPRA